MGCSIASCELSRSLLEWMRLGKLMKFTKHVVSSPLERLLLTVGRLISGAAYKLGRELQGYRFGGLSLTLDGVH